MTTVRAKNDGLPINAPRCEAKPDFGQLLYNKGAVTLSAADVVSGTGVNVSKAVFDDATFAAGASEGLAAGDIVAADGTISVVKPGKYEVGYTMAVEAEDVDNVGVVASLERSVVGAAAYAELKEARSYGVITDATGGTAGKETATLAGRTIITCAKGDILRCRLDFRAASAQKAGLLAFSFIVRQLTDTGDL